MKHLKMVQVNFDILEKNVTKLAKSKDADDLVSCVVSSINYLSALDLLLAVEEENSPVSAVLWRFHLKLGRVERAFLAYDSYLDISDVVDEDLERNEISQIKKLIDVDIYAESISRIISRFEEKYKTKY